MEGRTSFVTAHRLATIVNADRVVVLRDGSIAECGSHRELLARNGSYASLVRGQNRRLIAKDTFESGAG